jgi:hypothetical protein
VNRKVKYIKFWELREEDLDEGIQVWGKYLEESKRTPEKYPTYVFPPHGLGKINKGISVMEADNEEQLINYIIALTPPFKIKFEPLLDSNKIVETFLKVKKS